MKIVWQRQKMQPTVALKIAAAAASLLLLLWLLGKQAVVDTI